MRLILIDPHYLDPRSCEATIYFQSEQPVQMTDILTGKELSFANGVMTESVPAGSMRFIDLTYPGDFLGK